MLAPPWISIPPLAYGGILQVVDLLVTEFMSSSAAATPSLCSPRPSRARVTTLLDAQHPGEIRMSLYEAQHTARAFDDIDAAGTDGHPYDIVYDHRLLPFRLRRPQATRVRRFATRASCHPARAHGRGRDRVRASGGAPT
ncbi:MAG: hypothetical protein LC808_44325 [Actinobacteria bacterium]|nr:hypothetical protein [Actinomycetota bacterium]